MNIHIKPYSDEYAKKCAYLERYLWHEDDRGRELRFAWTYADNPIAKMPLCVIAVDDKDDVVGFRGCFLNHFWVNDEVILTAELCDAVVSETVRKQGVFQKMTTFLLTHLKDNGIRMVLDLGPSWIPYYSNKKQGFEDLSAFHSKYSFSLSNIFIERILKRDRMKWKQMESITLTINNCIYHLTNSVDKAIIGQIDNLVNTSKIHASLSSDILSWRFVRPGKNYVFCYVTDVANNLLSFMLLSTSDFYNYQLGFIVCKETSTFSRLFDLFKKKYKPSTVAVWDFALDGYLKSLITMVGMKSLPLINKFRKNPPSLIRTLQTNVDNSLDWNIAGMDIRKVENWAINKFDLDSF